LIVFRNRYFVWLLILIAIETGIALFSHHPVIRGFLGDSFSVIMLYAFLRTFFSISSFWAGNMSLMVAFFIELLQFIKFSKFVGVESGFVGVALGSTFDPKDFLAYVLGYGIIFLMEKSNLGPS
jgi:uncharacterized protein DUF2809